MKNKKVGKPPKVILAKPEPLQAYYQDRYGHRYSVARLIDESKHLVPFECPIASLRVGDRPWDDPTILELAGHMRQVKKADLKCPIILDCNGDIADGRHRIVKAILQGKSTILAVKIYWKLEPDTPATP